MGLRYELPLGYPNYEVANRMEQFDIATGLPVPEEWCRGGQEGLGAARWRGLPDGKAHRAASGLRRLLLAGADSDRRDGGLESASVRRIAPDFRTPYVQQWNMALQRQLPGEMQATISYVGTKGTRLTLGEGQLAGLNFNQAAPGAGAVNSRCRWPNDGAVSIFQSDFDSTYHSLQATLVKRWANSMQFQLAYTLSNEPIFNLAGARGNSDFDIRHQFRGTFSYELPVGRGKPLMSGAGTGRQRRAGRLAGEWGSFALHRIPPLPFSRAPTR